MKWIPLLILSFSSLALSQEDPDFKVLKKYESTPEKEKIPEPSEESPNYAELKWDHPRQAIPMEEIIESGVEHGHVKSGSTIIRLSDKKHITLTQPFYGKFYRQSDELGFKYILNNDGKVHYKISFDEFNNIEPQLAMYEPPLRYTPAPVNIIKSDYDKKLSITPEVAFLASSVNGEFMRDLANEPEAISGRSYQFGLHFLTKWKIPIKAGLAFHYETATYDLKGGRNVSYSSPSLGPIFRTKDLSLFDVPFRFQTQFRISPFARATVQNPTGESRFKFNSADLLAAFETPFKNHYGEFVLGLFYQSQWLNIKDQEELVSVTATNAINSSLGLSFSQVFE